MYNFISEKPTFERFNNIIEKMTAEKKEYLMDKIMKARAKQEWRNKNKLKLMPIGGSKKVTDDSPGLRIKKTLEQEF